MLIDLFDIDEGLLKAAKNAEKACENAFAAAENIYEHNSLKVLKAFTDNRVSASHLSGTTGYGYGDAGRDTLDKVFAQAFGAEDALVRHGFISGTHALTVALFGVLRPGNTLLSITGKPYDTLEDVIGSKDSLRNYGSLIDFGIKYKQTELTEKGCFDIDSIKKEIDGVTAVYIQRSRGYSLRPSLSVDSIGKIVKIIKEINENIIIIVDNCYGEFTETKEPTDAGADLIVGSLIKNPGGGIAETGGYIAGRADLIELCSYRLTSPGIGKEAGCSLNQNRGMYMGLFYAPGTVYSAVKTSIFACKLFSDMGYAVYPEFDEPRSDIISAICLKNEKSLIGFCEGIQKGSPVDSFVTPEAWEMPGYNSKVIMAAGAFTMGASSELSADAPLREPFAVWLQGGTAYPYGKAGVLSAAQNLVSQNLVEGEIFL